MGSGTTTVAEKTRLAADHAHDCSARSPDGNEPCRYPPEWEIVLECPLCGRAGSGPVCDFHKEQAEEWGVPHSSADGVCPLSAHLVLAVRR